MDKVITEPLRLGGFSLFLVFGMLSRIKPARARRLLSYIAPGMAVLSLMAGLSLAWTRIVREATAPLPQNRQPGQNGATKSPMVQQRTEGAGSLAVNDVTGNVTITVDQSSGTSQPKTGQEDKPEPGAARPKAIQQLKAAP